MSIKKAVFKVEGMTCSNCENIIKRYLENIDGIADIKASYAASRVEFSYDEKAVTIDFVKTEIEKKGYKLIDVKGGEAFSINQLLGLGIIALALFVIIKHTVGFNFIPEVNQSMSLGLLFVVGALTSLHCIAMCGGINLSQCMSYKHYDNSKLSRLKPSLLYNSGRVVSYTIIGGIVGGIGSAVSFSGAAKGAVAIISGVFMIIMGLNMLNIFPWLRKLNPRLPRIFGSKLSKERGKHGPFVVGLINGFMPCGPLQAMQLYALGTGSVLMGATSMFMFSIGTVPLMFGFGAISSFLSGRFTNKLMKASAVLVIALGVVMMGRGLSLSGINTVSASTVSGNVAVLGDNVQTVRINLKSGGYEPIVVQKGIPVRFIINAEEGTLNGCNNAIIIPKYGIQAKLKLGENIVEFTPDETGKVPYSCWMGMIRSSITVVDDILNIKAGGAGAGADDADDRQANQSPQFNSPEATIARFGGGVVPTDDIFVAKAENGLQLVTIKVDDSGYSPAAVVLQKGIRVKFVFDVKQLNSCNSVVEFQEYRGALDLGEEQFETPELEVTRDFTFRCWLGTINGYVKVVDDINAINLDEIKNEISSYEAPAGSGLCH